MIDLVRSLGKLSVVGLLMVWGCKPPPTPPNLPCAGDAGRLADGTCPEPVDEDAGTVACLATCPAGSVCQDNTCVQESCSGIRCGADELCAAGSCYPRNCPTEICPSGSVCSNNRCTLPSCVGVSCPNAGDVCAAGQCFPTTCANGALCAAGLVCESDRCIAPRCVGVTCSVDSVCVDGTCVLRSCNGSVCDPGYACDPLTLQCVLANCIGVACPSGQACSDGVCVGGGGTDGGATDAGAAPTKLGFVVQPTSADAGTPLIPAVKVAVQDSQGKTVTGSSANVTLSIGTNPGGSSLSGTTIAAASAGVATFSNLSLNKAGNGYTLQASSAGLSGATSQLFNVAPPPATKLAFTTPPSNTAAGANITPAVVVTVQDAQGNTVTGSTASVTLAVGTNPAGGALSGNLVATASNGIATFSGLSINKAGNGYTLTASSSGLSGPTSGTFNITPGAAHHLTFTTQPTTRTAGATTPAIVVAVQDSLDNTVTNSSASVTVTIGNNSGGSTLAGTNVVTAASGVAQFSTLSLNKTGQSYTLVASSPSIQGATSQSFDITPGAAHHLAFTTQPTTRAAGANTPAIVVTVQDSLNNTVTSSSASVTVALGNNLTGASLAGTTLVTATSGVATFSALSLNKAGTGYTLLASAPGVPTGATSQPFDISPANASQLFFAQAPTNAASGAAISPAVQVSVLDAYGNVVTSSSASVTMTIGTNPSSGTLSGTTTVPATAGVSIFSNLSINNAGTGYTLTASSSPLTPVTSASFNISGAGIAAKLKFTVQPSNAQAGVAIAPAVKVTVQDTLGGTVTGSTATISIAIQNNPGSGTLGGTVSVAAISGVATFSSLTISSAGTGYTLRATSAGLTQDTSTAFDISAAPAPTKLVITTTAQTVSAGVCSGSVTVQAQDNGGTPRAVSANTPVQLTGSATTTFYGLFGCLFGSPVTSVEIPAGGSEAYFYFKDSATGSFTLKVDDGPGGLAEGTQVENIVLGPTQIVFLTNPQTVAAGSCSSVVTLQAQTDAGTPSNPPSDLPVSVTDFAGGMTFWSNNSCSSSVGSTVTIPSTDNQVSFYFKQTSAGSRTLFGSSNLGFISQTETITPLAPSKAAFATSPQVVSGGHCSAKVTVQSQDVYGNGSNVSSPLNVSLSATGGTMQFFTDSACATSNVTIVQIPASNYGVDFYFKDSTLGARTVTAATALTSPTQVEQIVDPTPVKLAFATLPQSLASNTCSLVTTIQSQADAGSPANVASNTTINLAADGGLTFGFYGNSACNPPTISSVVILANQNSASFYFMDSKDGGDVQIIATSASGNLAPATQVETFSCSTAPRGAATLTIAFALAGLAMVRRRPRG